jgi:ABC-2 type transport system permease protein
MLTVFRMELTRALRRWRTYLFGAGLAGIPILIVVSLALSSSPPASNPDQPPFLTLILSSGLFAPLTALAVIQPFFLPLGAGLLSGDAIAGEASAGTLRYLLVRPVDRTRLVLAKYGFVMVQVAAGVVWVVVIGLVAGGIAFGYGSIPTLSGTTIGPGATLLRTVGVAGYLVAGVAGIAAIGVLISTLTDSAAGAAVAPVAVAIVSQILDHITSVRVIHPYLISHQWLAYLDLFRSPIEWGNVVRGLITFGIYTGVFLWLALAVFRRKDITS